jgi:acetyl/propionyl-CoA carboxylase alpha subunit
MKNVLVANRGEIAVRIIRAVQDLGMSATAIYAQDDAASLHVQKADQSVALEGSGAKAYLDAPAIAALARQQGCDAVHPGYGDRPEKAGADV